MNVVNDLLIVCMLSVNCSRIGSRWVTFRKSVHVDSH